MSVWYAGVEISWLLRSWILAKLRFSAALSKPIALDAQIKQTATAATTDTERLIHPSPGGTDTASVHSEEPIGCRAPEPASAATRPAPRRRAARSGGCRPRASTAASARRPART